MVSGSGSNLKYDVNFLSWIIFVFFFDSFLCWYFVLNLPCLFRTSRSEFIVSVNKYLEAKSYKFSVGMRFKMRFEGDEVPERRYTS